MHVITHSHYSIPRTGSILVVASAHLAQSSGSQDAGIPVWHLLLFTWVAVPVLLASLNVHTALSHAA